MYGFVITTAGEAMLARAAAGEALVLDAVMVGRGVVESAAAAKALNTLIDPVAAATSTAPAASWPDWPPCGSGSQSGAASLTPRRSLAGIKRSRSRL